jgi:hypothetical protein
MKGKFVINVAFATVRLVRRFLSKNTPFLQLKASVFALATPLYI